MADFLQILIISLVLGSLYALIALGYTMVFGVLKLINFAHSDIVVLGAWISVTVAAFLLPTMGIYLPEAPWWGAVLVLILAMVLCGAIGFCIERFAYRPIRSAPRLNALITAIGLSLLLQNTGQLQYNVVGPRQVSVAQGTLAQRIDARNVVLDQPLTIDPAGTFVLRFVPPGVPTTVAATSEAAATQPSTQPIAPPGSIDVPLPLKPGTYPAGEKLTLERGLPARFAGATFQLLRTNLPLRFPFGAMPASMPRGLLPDDTGRITADAQAKTVVLFPNRAVFLQLNLYSAGQARADGTREQIYKPVRITLVDTIIVGTAVVLMVALQFLVFGTRIGTAMRAVSYNIDTSALMGIPVDRIISLTFVTGTMLAAAAGFLYALRYAPIQQPAHNAWVLLGLKAFVAAVVGGIGNIRGAAVGGFLIAFIEQFGAYACQQVGWDQGSALTDVFVFALLIIVLLVKPTGLFGSAVREKV